MAHDQIAAPDSVAAATEPLPEASSKPLPKTLRDALPLVLAPGWAELPWLIHGFSTRAGGVSTVYRSGEVGGALDEVDGALNLGFTAADNPEHVRENRERLLQRLTGEPLPETLRLVTLRQTHSAVTWRAGPGDAQAPGLPAIREGDGLMTDEPGVLLGIQTADCVPVLVVDPVRRAVAAFHAGWRGTVAGIVEAGVARMHAEFNSQPDDLLAAIGPAIGACCYTVGDELRERFTARFSYAEELFTNGPTLRLDLKEANRRQLLAAGLQASSVYTATSCTSCEVQRFFSHRKEQGATGRMLAVIGIRSK